MFLSYFIVIAVGYAFGCRTTGMTEGESLTRHKSNTGDRARRVHPIEGLDLGQDANIISDRRDAIHNRTVLSPFGFGKGERWHSRSEGLTRCDCYQGINLGVISRRAGDRVKR
jgi:hypothetical protein